MVSLQPITPRILSDLERIIYRMLYAMNLDGVHLDDSYLKKLSNEIYIYLRQTKTYDPQGESINPLVDKGKFYEHAAGTDPALDFHLEWTFGVMNKTQWDNLFKCNQCELTEFKHAQNLVRHLFWHSDPVVSRDPNDDDEVKFEVSHEWLFQYKKDFLWPEDIYKNILGIDTSSDSSEMN